MEQNIVIRCSVEGCRAIAGYQVFHVRTTSYPDEVIESEDPNCPYLCEKHMQENENNAVGTRAYHHGCRVSYPYTSKSGYGFSTYEPLPNVHSLLYTRPDSIAVHDVLELNEELIEHLRKNPGLMRELHPRMFEELIAEVFRNQGFDVELTPATHDGGIDLYAARKDSFGSLLYVIECKRYRTSCKVGIEVVQRLYGVVQSKMATKGIIATTSTFTRSAMEFAKPLAYQLSLHDFKSLSTWLGQYKMEA
jgi:restriction endonuclease Mrr